MEQVQSSIGLQHKSLVEEIVEKLKQKILDGGYAPGERIYEQQLCDQFGVSRSPIREAFRILEAQGFLVSEKRKGVSVADISAQDAIDIYMIRARLESLAVYLLVRNFSPVLLEELKRLNREMEEAFEQDDFYKYFQFNSTFHELIIQNCGSRKLIEMLSNFSSQTVRYRYKVLSSPGKIKASLQKHSELIKSIEMGDAEKAEKLRRDDILENINFITENIDHWDD